LIGCGWRNWRRFMNASCPTRADAPTGPLRDRPKATRRF
jgi:hypothetical protein